MSVVFVSNLIPPPEVFVSEFPDNAPVCYDVLLVSLRSNDVKGAPEVSAAVTRPLALLKVSQLSMVSLSPPRLSWRRCEAYVSLSRLLVIAPRSL